MTVMSSVKRPDRQALFRLLADLNAKYPDGLGWLERRLDDIEAGRARLHQVMVGPDLAAVGIETPKGSHRLKLSTFIVAPASRRAGLGRLLLDEMKRKWRIEEIEQVVVTVDEHDHATTAFFLQAGFIRVRGALARYSADRADLVLCWRPQREARYAPDSNVA